MSRAWQQFAAERKRKKLPPVRGRARKMVRNAMREEIRSKRVTEGPWRLYNPFNPGKRGKK